MGRSAVWRRGLAWLARRAKPPALVLGILAGFASLAALALGAPEPLPDRSVEPFAWTRAETALSWPVRDEPDLPPAPPKTVTERHDLPQTPAIGRKTQVLHEWHATGAGDLDPQTFAIGDLRISMGSAEQILTKATGHVDLNGAVVMVEAPGMAPWRMRRTDAHARAEFGVGRIDAARPGPQVLIGLYTGGMRCCMSYVLLTPDAGRWRETSLEAVVENHGLDGLFDGWPIDRDGDGSPELKFLESSYRYMGEVWSPPVFLQIHDGKVVDVSDRPGLRPQYRALLKEAELECRRHDNRACGTMLLVAGRLGDDRHAWRTLLANYDRHGEKGDYFPQHISRYRRGEPEAAR